MSRAASKRNHDGRRADLGPAVSAWHAPPSSQATQTSATRATSTGAAAQRQKAEWGLEELASPEHWDAVPSLHPYKAVAHLPGVPMRSPATSAHQKGCSIRLPRQTASRSASAPCCCSPDANVHTGSRLLTGGSALCLLGRGVPQQHCMLNLAGFCLHHMLAFLVPAIPRARNESTCHTTTQHKGTASSRSLHARGYLRCEPNTSIYIYIYIYTRPMPCRGTHASAELNMET